MHNNIKFYCRNVNVALDRSNFHLKQEMLYPLLMFDPKLSNRPQSCITYDPPGPSKIGFQQGV
jgi:hypothetical protein